MDCQQVCEAVHGYVDGELDPLAAAAIERHLPGCPACQREYEGQTALRSAIRTHADYYDAPADLRARMKALTAPKAAGVRPGAWRWLPMGAAIAATVVVTWIAVMQFSGLSASDGALDDVVTGHARAMVAGRPTDVASSDTHTVKPWLSSRLDFSPPAPDLMKEGFPLAGGRVDYVDHRPAAVLVYRRRGHLIDVFVWPASRTGAPLRDAQASRNGYNLLTWSDAGMNYSAISDVAVADLRTLAAEYRRAK